MEIRRDNNGFMSGMVIVDGISQKLNVVPRGVEMQEFLSFLKNHVEVAMASGKHGNLTYRKGKGN